MYHKIKFLKAGLYHLTQPDGSVEQFRAKAGDVREVEALYWTYLVAEGLGEEICEAKKAESVKEAEPVKKKTTRKKKVKS